MLCERKANPDIKRAIPKKIAGGGAVFLEMMMEDGGEDERNERSGKIGVSIGGIVRSQRSNY